MDKDELQIKILLKINEVLPALYMSRDQNFNEQVSCVVCNLASAYQSLEPQKVNRRLARYEDTGLEPEEIERLMKFVLGNGDIDL